MNNKALTLSLIMAVFAYFMVNSYVTSVEDEARKKFGTEVLVITAKRDIKEMEMLNETVLGLKVMPKSFLEPAAISFEKKEEDKDTTRVIKNMAGYIAMVPIKKGEQVTLTKVSEPSIRSGLAPQVTPGKRAVSIPVSETSSVSKLIKPGDRVDLIAILDPGGKKDQKIAKTVLQDTIILSIGRNVSNNVPRVVEMDPGGGGKERVRSLVEDFSFSSVTLEVDPTQAQTIALLLAMGESSLTLSLRNNDDGDRYNLPVTTFQDLNGLVRLPAGQK